MPRTSLLLRSSTLRHALIYIGLFSAAVLVLFGYVYRSTFAFVHTQSDRVLEADYLALQAAYDRDGRAGVVAAVIREGVAGRLDYGARVVAGPSFAPIAGNLATWPADLRDSRHRGAFVLASENAQAPPRRFEARYGTLSNGDHLLVAREADDLDRFVGAMAAAFAGTVVLMFTIAGYATAAVSQRTVGRIDAINATSRAIMNSGLGNRIPTRGTRDEWDQLAENLNAMLARIEGLMQEIRQVSDNVAHDLRTPLTRMRGRLERASKRRLDADACHALVCDTIAELDQVLGMFASLLRIARLEAQDCRRTSDRLDLAAVAGQITELFDAAAEEKGGRVTLVSDGPTFVAGNRDLLFDALSNLVDNAVKHGGSHGNVTITVGEDGRGPFVAVADEGPGIPPDERKRVLERFYRLERSRSTPGNGLGLSLVAAVAQSHDARIEMASEPAGFRIGLRFPSENAPSTTPQRVAFGR